MRYDPVTSVSWIPPEAVESIVRYGFDAEVGHYDSPLPDTLADLEEWRAAPALARRLPSPHDRLASADASPPGRAALGELAGSHEREGATRCPSLRW
jgi:hypothetical protein